jgi:hypothetical protein
MKVRGAQGKRKFARLEQFVIAAAMPIEILQSLMS